MEIFVDTTASDYAKFYDFARLTPRDSRTKIRQCLGMQLMELIVHY